MRSAIRTLLLAGTVMTTLSLSGQNVRSNSHEVDVRSRIAGCTAIW